MVSRERARTLVDLGKDLSTATPGGDVLDMFAVAVGNKPLAGMAACYTATGEPAWDAVDTAEDALHRGDLEARLDAAGFQWHVQPVETVHDDRTVTWYELLVSQGGEAERFVERAGPRPGDRTEREYGRALGYPESAVDWFVEEHDDARSVFDVVRTADGHSDRALALAASVPYVPAPTPQGAVDAIEDGRDLTHALGALDAAAGTDYVETLLGERVDDRLSAHDRALTTRWRDPLHRAMHA